MPELDLDRLEALANAATPPPWTNDDNDVWTADGDRFVAAPVRVADAEFVAAAREGLPQLIAEVRRLHATEGVCHHQNARYLDLLAERDQEHRLRVEAEGAWGRWQRRAETVEAERDALAAKVAAVRDLHQPIDALNTTARPGQQLVKVCSGCGTDDGNWQRWPCPTIRALDEKPRIATAATETGQGTPSSPSGHTDSPPDANGAQKGAGR